jgi:predicted transcriptional regulator
MKNKRRERSEIIVEYLVRAKDWIQKSHLMYGVGINQGRHEDYLNALLKTENLEERVVESHHQYRTTEKGRDFLKTFRNAKEGLDEIKACLEH